MPCAVVPFVHHATFPARSPARAANRPFPRSPKIQPATPSGYAKVGHGIMKLLSRVVWSEGMPLGPHHFQVQSRYFEDSIQFAISSLWFASYGLAGLELDADALYNGSVSLLHARGILPDGLPFNRSEEHTSELQSLRHLVCRLLLEKKTGNYVLPSPAPAWAEKQAAARAAVAS